MVTVVRLVAVRFVIACVCVCVCVCARACVWGGRRRKFVVVTYGCGPGYPQRESVVAFPRRMAFSISLALAIEVEREPELVGTRAAFERMHILPVVIVIVTVTERTR
ncbi:hypothetical protein BJV74DRAFT_99404 [Russula compacta]|nr:hypothetical protein BJV74DRAFT_99404 [Russula compacta]